MCADLRYARSIKYQLTVAKLPLAKDIYDFDFPGTPVNETLVRDLATGVFVADQRNAVLIGGTSTGKSHLAIAIARALIRDGTRGRFFNDVDLVNRLETESGCSRFGTVLLRGGHTRIGGFGVSVCECVRLGWFRKMDRQTVHDEAVLEGLLTG